MASFWQQLKALLWRNILLKKRNRAQLLQELLFPIYFVGLLVMIQALTKPQIKPGLKFPVHDLNDSAYGHPFAGGGSILVAPNTSQVDMWMKNVVAQLPAHPGYRLFSTAEQVEAEYLSDNADTLAGIIFNISGDTYSYAIRMVYGALPSISSGFSSDTGACNDDKAGTSAQCTVNTYLTTGFAQLQVAVENVLMESLNVTSDPKSRKIKVQMMDKGDFSPDSSYIQTIASIYFVFSFSFMANFLAVNIVAEKEKKIKDGMLMMGLRNSVFWLSWSIVYVVIIIVASSMMTIIIVAAQFFKNSNMLLLFICFVLYGCSIISFAFMITPFFNKARVAGAITGFSTVIISCIYLAISQTRNAMSYDSNAPAAVQWIICLLSPISFATFIDQGIFLDIHMNGFDFTDILTYGKFPLYAPILMLIVDIFLYTILTVYFDNVIPGEYGVKKSPLYFLEGSYWCPTKYNTEKSRLMEQDHQHTKTADVEPVGRDMEGKVAMKISSLSKSFKIDGKIQKAVNGFGLDIYESQITCLLGHNGAGKTTLINMLTGVISPTSGNAKIMGYDITKASDMDKIRSACGICPQHNILYDDLSCREHLEMFANIKGVQSHIIDKAVQQALSDVDLKSQSETFSKDLSGGQKRKLSVAIALIGDPKVIFLDEPTAGMDPFSRRHLWSLLKKMKEGKVVLLTTHFMDEADILADRKAFIRKGKLRCCGSSLFLKSKFGIGYHLTMVVTPDCKVDKVTTMLKEVIPDIERQRVHGRELGYTVPLRDVSKFPELFGILDEVAEERGIKSYGVSMTTLEEVFLKLEADELVDKDDDESPAEINACFDADNHNINAEMLVPNSSIEAIGISTVHGSDLTKQRFWALLKIRFLLMIRDIKAVIFQIFLPVVLVIVGLALSKVNQISPSQTTHPFIFTPGMYVRPAHDQGQTPAMLVLDAINNSGSQAVIAGWKAQYMVDVYANGTNTSSVALHYLGVEIDSVVNQDLANFLVLYNATAQHSIPVTINMVTQNILKSSNINANISGISYPWPLLGAQPTYNAGLMFSAMLVGLAFILILPGFASEVVRDREWKLRSQLRLSGVTFNIYWGTIYICDMLIYLIPTVIIIIVLLAMQIPGLSSGGALAALILLFMTNIPFNILWALVLSFMFNKAEMCTAYLPVLINLISIIPYLVVSLVDMIAQNHVAIIIHYIACIIDPPYIIFGGFYFINKVGMVAALAQTEVTASDYFKFDNHIIIPIIIPIIHFLWMYWLLRVLDVWKAGGHFTEAFPCFSKFLNTVHTNNTDVIDDEDEDIKAERLRIDHLSTNDSQEFVAYMCQLRKTFVKRTKSKGWCKPGSTKFKIAVRNLSIGVEPGEVLGLLGPNGAGKSTALNMMIAETAPTCGKVIVSGQNIRSNFISVLEALGYCPQHDALWEKITLEEHIRCFAAIKGVATSQLEKVVDYYVKELKLEDNRKKQSKKLSGGTKRKLSYIMSILGSPHLVLLDEPSTGLDPQSKRFLWDTISSSFSNTNKGAILTTHYMEEADALCGRVGIMINGQLKCLGSTQHLKSKYGSGYILDVKLACREAHDVDSLMTKLEKHLKELFPGLVNVERFQERAQFSIPKDDVTSLGKTFAKLESCKQTHSLEEYSFSQSSLEQVFLHFARQQLEEGEDASSDRLVSHV